MNTAVCTRQTVKKTNDDCFTFTEGGTHSWFFLYNFEDCEYTPYGEMWIERTKPTSTYETPFRFTSKEWDQETNLYYYGARYMDPRTSRWISADPSGPKLASPDRDGYSIVEATNWYSYTGNNPVNYTDPTGRESVRQQIIMFKDIMLQYAATAAQQFPDSTNAQAAMKREIFIMTASFFSGRGYEAGPAFDNAWNNQSGNLVCHTFGETILRVTESASINEMFSNDRNYDSAQAVFRGFGLPETINPQTGNNVFKPSELTGLDKSKVYGLSIFSKSFPGQSWWPETGANLYLQDGGESYQTIHLAFLYHDEANGWTMVDQTGAPVNFQEWADSAYNKDGEYRMRVYTVNPDE